MQSEHKSKLADLLFYRLDDGDFLSSFLKGHLILESLLKHSIANYDAGLGRYADKLKFSGLVGLSFEVRLLNENQKVALNAINKIRNKLAHDVFYEPTRSELLNVFRLAKKGFSDMTDGLEQGIGDLENDRWSKGDGETTIADLFIQICYDLEILFDKDGQTLIPS